MIRLMVWLLQCKKLAHLCWLSVTSRNMVHLGHLVARPDQHTEWIVHSVTYVNISPCW